MQDRRRVDYDNLAKLVTKRPERYSVCGRFANRRERIYKVLPSTLVPRESLKKGGRDNDGVATPWTGSRTQKSIEEFKKPQNQYKRRYILWLTTIRYYLPLR